MLITPALSYGPEVAALDATAGGVLAVLNTAVYLASDNGLLVGIVGADAPDGPLSLRVADFPAVQATLVGRYDAPFTATADALTIAGQVRVNLADGQRWIPSLPRQAGSAAARREAAEALIAVLSEAPSMEGAVRLAPLLPNLLLGGPQPALPRPAALDDAVRHRIAARLIRLRMALETREWARGAATLIELLGLGPGLTPTGDDVVMGLLAALVWQAPTLAARREVGELVAAIRAAAPRRTTAISVRLLWHAGSGVLYAPALALGAALLAGDPAAVPAPARRLLAIGSTSGADLAVGLLAGILFGFVRRPEPSP